MGRAGIGELVVVQWHPGRLTHRDGTGAGIDRNCGAKVDSDAPTVTISAPSLYFQRFATTGQASDPTTPIVKIAPSLPFFDAAFEPAAPASALVPDKHAA